MFNDGERFQDPREASGVRRYQILAALASGGMSQVYRAWDRWFGREVALKTLDPQLATDPSRVERFHLEARRIAALQHPNIVPLLDHGEQDGRLFLVMPLYPYTLRDLLVQRRILSLPHTLHLTTQIASALDYAHQLGIIHRDIKPENILLDTGHRALLSDFGIAKASPTAPNHLMTSAPLSNIEAGRPPIVSLEYSAPEHLLGRQLDGRADVFGLAVVIYEMLTGRVPFALTSERIYTFVVAMLTERPTPPSHYAPPPFPVACDAVLLRALDANPARRYDTPGAMVAELNRLNDLATQPSYTTRRLTS